MPPPTNHIRTARHTLGITQEQFARKIGVSSRTVSRWESSRNTPHPVFLSLIDSLVRIHQAGAEQALQ